MRKLIPKRSTACVFTAGIVFFLNAGLTALSAISWLVIVGLFLAAEFCFQDERST